MDQTLLRCSRGGQMCLDNPMELLQDVGVSSSKRLLIQVIALGLYEPISSFILS